MGHTPKPCTFWLDAQSPWSRFMVCRKRVYGVQEKLPELLNRPIIQRNDQFCRERRNPCHATSTVADWVSARCHVPGRLTWHQPGEGSRHERARAHRGASQSKVYRVQRTHLHHPTPRARPESGCAGRQPGCASRAGAPAGRPALSAGPREVLRAHLLSRLERRRMSAGRSKVTLPRLPPAELLSPPPPPPLCRGPPLRMPPVGM